MSRNRKANKPGTGRKIELVPVLQAPQRTGFDIGKWRAAIKNAEDPDRPSRTLLLDIYNDIMLDLHLTSVIDKRIENIKGTEIVYTTPDGKTNEKINDLIASPWFSNMLGDILDARFWGFTSMWVDLSGGEFHEYKRFDRRHVSVEKGLFLRRPDDLGGIDITEPPYTNYILTANSETFGLLIKAAAWVLLKRGDVSDWATFNEILAAPIRVGKYPDFNQDAKKEMAKAIGQQGAMPWYLIPSGADLQLIQNNSSGSTTAYEKFAEFCDKQLSKGFLHGTMTLDAEGGQYKGDTHADSESVIHKSDRRFTLNFLNTAFKDLLEIHGFNPGNGKFSFIVEEHICLKERLDMDLKLNGIIKIAPEYFYNKYNIPVPEGGAENVSPAIQETPRETPPANKKSRFRFFD